SNFWDDISIPYWSMPENTAHPTQKPEKLIAKLILASSNAGDVVLDPFAGSGTTAVTAKKLGRHFVTIEQNELYCAWAQKRLEMADEDPSIQGFSDGVFWERNTWTGQRSNQEKASTKPAKKQEAKPAQAAKKPAKKPAKKQETKPARAVKKPAKKQETKPASAVKKPAKKSGKSKK
ncbi:MAG: site-specific DNA-methyltransferase, partial [Lachnospiraceae bacterium]|nr:site-specific DNA-methyltransferase [Lachnospiraceae bacterium]